MVHFEGQGLLVPIAATANTYAAGKQVGGLNQLAGVVPDSAGALELVSLALSDTAHQAIGFNLLFFNKAITVPGDNVAFDVSAADAAAFIGLVTVATASYLSTTNRAFVAMNNIKMIMQTAKAKTNNTVSNSLWCVLTTLGTPTYTANCLNLVLGFKKAR